jgi:hypothetical protein
MTTAREDLGAAERIIQTLLGYSDHMVHNRPGMVVTDARHTLGVRWEPVTHKEEGGEKVVYRLSKIGKREVKTKVGVLRADGKIVNGGRAPCGEYRPAGLFPEVVAWFYQQVAEVWKADNEFAARWASFQWPQEHRDLKVVLAAFMLVQARKGDPILDGGKVVFHDDDFRDVGEAMCLLFRKDGKDFNPKLLLRVHEVLTLPAVAAINRALGFGRSARTAFLGRWPKAVEKWLQHREQNPKLLEGLVKAGFRTTVMELARRIGYKPETPGFFEILRWKQAQAKDGRRTLAIGKAVKAAESWVGLTEEQVCQRITQEKPNWKLLVGRLPKELGVTRAIMAAAIESGSLSDKDLIILTPTLEELGLLNVQSVRERWEKATRAVEDMRAANIARNVKSQAVKEQLQQAADSALQKAVEKVIKNLRVYFIVDISGSMHDSLPRAKAIIGRFLQGFPLASLHVAVFNTAGREVQIGHASAAGVDKAFRGISAGGGTNYGMGVRALRDHKPKDDEDTLFIFVGDEGQSGTFDEEVRQSGLRPLAFGLVKVPGEDYGCVTNTAAVLGVPCFRIDENTFADPYAIPRAVQALVAATPVGKVAQAARVVRLTLVDQILKTDLLKKPVWA